LPEFLNEAVAQRCEEIPWPLMALVLVVGRLCEPGSELSLAEQGYERTALPELLGIPAAKVNDDRLYRALDKLLPAKAALEQHLKARLGELFGLSYDLLLYDVTSTYFEGLAERNPQAQRGYSRDHRPDCKQVCIALVVSREGIPLGYEVFAGNRSDVKTVEEIVELIESRYGTADRIWVMDRGMVSEDNLDYLREKQRRYLVGTPKSQLRRYEAEIASGGWSEIREGLEVKLCPGPDGSETFILCRSAERREKEKAGTLWVPRPGRRAAGPRTAPSGGELCEETPLFGRGARADWATTGEVFPRRAPVRVAGDGRGQREGEPDVGAP
jgi:hypothetical protein